MNQSIWKDIKNNFRQADDVIVKLIYVNVGVFLIESILFVLYFLFTGDRSFVFGLFHEWFAIPASPAKLMYRPWTPITYMFLHAGIFHLLINMLILYWFGRIFQQVMSSRKVLPIYIYGGLMGAAFYLLAYNLFPAFDTLANQNAVLLGASAGVMAMVVATAYLVPNFTLYLLLFGPVRIKYIALVLVGIDLFYGIASRNAGGSFAHLGGALFGFLFISQLKKGKDWSSGFIRFLDTVKGYFTSSSRNIKVEYKSRQAGSARYQYNDQKKSKQKRIDEILDKIAQSGYDSLTKEEKEFLFKASKDD